MITKIAEYAVQPDALETVQQAIQTFVSQVKQQEPDTTYNAYRKNDTSTFIHFMQFPSPQAEIDHSSAPYTQEFVQVLYPLCEEKPTFTDITTIDG